MVVPALYNQVLPVGLVQSVGRLSHVDGAGGLTPPWPVVSLLVQFLQESGTLSTMGM